MGKDLSSAGLFQVEFYRNFTNNAELPCEASYATDYCIFLSTAFRPPGCAVSVYAFTWKNSVFHQGTFAGYYAREGAFCYVLIDGERPRCRSPPSALMSTHYKIKFEKKGNHYEC